jgi:surface antigen Omp85-like protein/surface antigen-like variable number repeat protein
VFVLVLAVALTTALSDLSQSFDREVVAEIQIHGNLATSDEEIARLAGLEIGMPVGPTTTEEMAERLRATKQFERVEVLKRFASISDPTRVTIVIIVDEGRVHIEMTGDPSHPTRVVRNRGPQLLFLPVLDVEDGYGLAYGLRVTVPHPTGPRSHLSFPFTWGGDKRAAVEFDKTFEEALLTRIAGEVSFGQRENPFFHADDHRGRLVMRAERAIASSFRIGGTAAWQHVSFLGANESFTDVGFDAVVDTRLDPVLARNAVYARAALDHFSFLTGGTNRLQLEGRGYVGLFRQNVLRVSALRDDSDRRLPPYLEPMLGGMANLRGFRTGTAIGDTLAAVSAEVLVPLTSPLSFGKIGVSVFVDAGAVYDKDQRLADQTLKRGVGGSVWFSAAFVRLNVAVAHGIGASTRVHVGGGVSF